MPKLCDACVRVSANIGLHAMKQGKQSKLPVQYMKEKFYCLRFTTKRKNSTDFANSTTLFHKRNSSFVRNETRSDKNTSTSYVCKVNQNSEITIKRFIPPVFKHPTYESPMFLNTQHTSPSCTYFTSTPTYEIYL